jgi:hypothetical protein
MAVPGQDGEVHLMYRALAVPLAALLLIALPACGADTETTTATDVRTTTQTTTKTVATVPVEALDGLLGGAVITDLLDRGAIGEATPVEPKVGWETEFELDVAGMEIRFRRDAEGQNVEWRWFRGAAGKRLSDEIKEVTTARGFEPVVE